MLTIPQKLFVLKVVFAHNFSKFLVWLLINQQVLPIRVQQSARAQERQTDKYHILLVFAYFIFKHIFYYLRIFPVGNKITMYSVKLRT